MDIPVLFLYPTEAASSIATLSLAVVALSALSGTIAYARARRIDYGLGSTPPNPASSRRSR